MGFARRSSNEGAHQGSKHPSRGHQDLEESRRQITGVCRSTYTEQVIHFTTLHHQDDGSRLPVPQLQDWIVQL